MYMIFLLLVLSYLVDASPVPAYNLQCEKNLVALTKSKLSSSYYFATDNPHPHFSWNIAHTTRGATQTAFRVLVSRDISFKSIYWDSGIVKTHQQEISYRGPPLKGDQLYFWKVKWWDTEAESIESIEIGHFLLANVDWSGVKWMYSPSYQELPNAPTFVKKLNLDFPDKQITKATLYISGLGFFRVLINNNDLYKLANPPISLAPGWANYEIKVPYLVFDVTKPLTQNLTATIAITLGEGWRNTSEFMPKDKSPVHDDIAQVVRLILKIEFGGNFSTMLVKSDNTWDLFSSHIEDNSIYNGEVYDATTSIECVQTSVETTGPAGEMYLPQIPYIAETGKVDKPVKIYRLKFDPEKQVVDFGNNTAGIVKLKKLQLVRKCK